MHAHAHIWPLSLRSFISSESASSMPDIDPGQVLEIGCHLPQAGQCQMPKPSSCRPHCGLSFPWRVYDYFFSQLKSLWQPLPHGLHWGCAVADSKAEPSFGDQTRTAPKLGHVMRLGHGEASSSSHPSVEANPLSRRHTIIQQEEDGMLQFLGLPGKGGSAQGPPASPLLWPCPQHSEVLSSRPGPEFLLHSEWRHLNPTSQGALNTHLW
jgi:hypothetical protein